MRNLFTIIGTVLALLSVSVVAFATPYYSGGYYYQQQQYDYYPTVIAIPVAPDYYYSVFGEGEVGKRIAEEMAKEFQKAIKEQQAPMPKLSPKPKLSREAFNMTTSAGDLDQQVLSIFNNRCIGCHKPGAAKPGVPLIAPDRQLFVYQDVKKEASRRQKVYDTIETGEMPLNGPALGQSDRAILKRWLDQAKAKKE